VLVIRTVAFGVFGLLVGSFLTVLVARMPVRRSVVGGRSECPACGNPIGARDNIPVVSYLMLRGRCRTCGGPISAEYPLTELATAALFVVASLALRPVWIAAMLAPFLAVMLAASLIDLRHRIIPTRLVYASLAVFGAALAVLALTGQRVSLATALLGSAAYGGGLFVLWFVYPKGMGFGDVRLAFLIGLVLGALGWAYVAVAGMAGVVTGAVGGAVVLALGGSRKSAMPFGPFMAAGALIAVVFGPSVAGWYTGLLH
jgi:leader peptidase (prepilin peptidase) / N-methyltransferase